MALTRARTWSFQDPKSVADRILGRGQFSEAVELLFVDEGSFYDALGAFETYRDHPLSFTDATTIALMERYRIDHLLTFDADFDGIVDRLDPNQFDGR